MQGLAELRRRVDETSSAVARLLADADALEPRVAKTRKKADAAEAALDSAASGDERFTSVVWDTVKETLGWGWTLVMFGPPVAALVVGVGTCALSVCDSSGPYRFEALGSAIASDDPAAPAGSGCDVRIEHRRGERCRAVVECNGAPVYDEHVACWMDERQSVDTDGETSTFSVLVAEGKRGFTLDEGSGIATASSAPPASARIVLHRWEEEGDL